MRRFTSVLIGLTLAMAGPALAQRVRVTVVGTVGSGVIANNYDLIDATDLTGQPFTATFDVDGNTPGAESLVEDYPELTQTVIRGDRFLGSVSPISGRIVIGSLVDQRLDGREVGYLYAYADRTNPFNDSVGISAVESRLLPDGSDGGYLDFTIFSLAQGTTTGFWQDPLQIDFDGLANQGHFSYESNRYDAFGLASLYYLNADLAPTRFTIAAAVPEPQSWALLIAGFGLVGATLRRRRTAATLS